MDFYCFNKGKKQLPVEAFNYIQIALLFCFSPFSSCAREREVLPRLLTPEVCFQLAAEASLVFFLEPLPPTTHCEGRYSGSNASRSSSGGSPAPNRPTCHRSSWHCGGQLPGSSQSWPWGSDRKPSGALPSLPNSRRRLRVECAVILGSMRRNGPGWGEESHSSSPSSVSTLWTPSLSPSPPNPPKIRL